MYNSTEILTTLHELTDDERLDAKEEARAVMLREIGDKPQREQFVGVTVSEYPRWVRSLVAGLMAVVFFAAALPSLFRLYDAGRIAHFDATNNLLQARLVGVSTFALAEFLIIVATLGISIYARAGWQRVMFALAIVMGLGVAFVGNWQEVQPDTLFKWLETIAPPLTVVVMSFVGERLIMDAVRKSHADERAYQEALAAWQEATRAIEQHQRWAVVYGRALVKALKTANSKGTGAKARKEFMAAMPRKGWAVLVQRERQIDSGDWLTKPAHTIEVGNSAPPPPQPEGNDTDNPFGDTAPALVKVDRAYTPAMPNGNGHIANGNGNGHSH